MLDRENGFLEHIRYDRTDFFAHHIFRGLVDMYRIDIGVRAECIVGRRNVEQIRYRLYSVFDTQMCCPELRIHNLRLIKGHEPRCLEPRRSVSAGNSVRQIERLEVLVGHFAVPIA